MYWTTRSSEDDSIGSLYLLRCHLEDKISGEALDPAAALTVEVHESTTEVSALSKTVAPPPPALTTHADSTCRQVPHFSMNVDGHGCTGLILGCTEAAAGQEENVVVQLRRILGTVCDLLKSVCGPLPEGVDGRTVLKDAIFVHVYLVDMALFPDVNALYAEYFGTVAPPSRFLFTRYLCLTGYIFLSGTTNCRFLCRVGARWRWMSHFI